MNKAELVSHVAAETSTIRAAAERMVRAVFSAIADALARDEPVAIPGFGKFAVRSRAARQGRNPRTGEPVAVSASKMPSRRSNRRKPFVTRSTNSMMAQAGGRMLAIHFGNAAAARAYLPNAVPQNLVSAIASASDALSVAGHRGPPNRSPSTLDWLWKVCGRGRDTRTFGIGHACEHTLSRAQSLKHPPPQETLPARCTTRKQT